MDFEEDYQNMISKVRFRRVSNDFQERLKEDIRLIQSPKKVFFSEIKQETFTKWKLTLGTSLDGKNDKKI